MLTPNETNAPRDAVCPKQPWVLLMFSDDEALPPGAELPRGLRFHLSRCASCRAIAEKLMDVSARLSSATETAEPDGLFDRAAARARTALRHGAGLTGRVHVEDEPLDAWCVDPEARRAQHRAVLRWVAVAACIGLVGASLAVWRLGTGSSGVPGGVAPNEGTNPAYPSGWDLAAGGNLVGPVPEANPPRQPATGSEAPDERTVYVLAPERLDAARRRRAVSGVPILSSPAGGRTESFTKRLLDNPQTAVSTVNMAKDR